VTDLNKDVLAYHDDEVTLLQPQRTAMRDRRNANRDRLKTRLKANGKSLPQEFIKQGSYAMLTMVQDADNDYDIDDGAYFAQSSLKDKNGIDMSAADARQMVCNALKDDRFNKQPEVRDSCVRVYYDLGYHVDIPVYRIRDTDGEYELACGDKWVVSRAADVEDWFDNENQCLSPDEDNGRQFRRITRALKKFSRSRKAWKNQIAAGFTITKLAADHYVASKDHEDISLRATMKRIYAQLCRSLEVVHPVTPGAMLTKGPDDKRTAFFRDQLKQALADLQVLDDPACTRKQALAAWDKVFNTSFFSDRLDSDTAKAVGAFNQNLGMGSLKPAAVASGFTFPDRAVSPNKPAGFA